MRSFHFTTIGLLCLISQVLSAPILAGVETLDDSNWHDKVLADKTNAWVVVFTAEVCRACAVFAPKFEAAANSQFYGSEIVKFGAVEIKENPLIHR